MNKLLFIALFLLLAVAYIACTNDNSCHENRYVVMTSNFYTIKNDTTKTFTVDSIWVKGLGNDSMLYSNSKSVTSISMPLQKMNDTSRFVIRFNAIYDTLTVIHANIQKYLSLECGCLVTHKLDSTKLSYTQHKVKRIKVKYDNVSTTKRENLQIYF